MSIKIASVSFCLYVDDTGTPAALGSENSASLTRNHTPVDVTDKQSLGDSEFLAGRIGWEMSGEGFYISGDAAYGDLMSHWAAGTEIGVKMRDSVNHRQWSGNARITALSISGADPDAVKNTVTLTGNGALTASTY